jgi:MFS family permease
VSLVRWVVLGVSTAVNAIAWGCAARRRRHGRHSRPGDRHRHALVRPLARDGHGGAQRRHRRRALLYAASGFGFGMRIAQLSAIPADLFGGPHLGAILGVIQSGGGLGGAIGPFLGGWLFDVTGTYTLAFVTAALAIAGSAVAAWFAARPVAGASR